MDAGAVPVPTWLTPKGETRREKRGGSTYHDDDDVQSIKRARRVGVCVDDEDGLENRGAVRVAWRAQSRMENQVG
jgi:hypothetical protein